jgi:predicted nucleic-acid-binding protein
VIGLDTNVLIRYIVRDDLVQAEAATRLVESEWTADNPGLINPIVLCELVWVLTRGYGYDRLIVMTSTPVTLPTLSWWIRFA